MPRIIYLTLLDGSEDDWMQTLDNFLATISPTDFQEKTSLRVKIRLLRSKYDSLLSSHTANKIIKAIDHISKVTNLQKGYFEATLEDDRLCRQGYRVLSHALNCKAFHEVKLNHHIENDHNHNDNNDNDDNNEDYFFKVLQESFFHMTYLDLSFLSFTSSIVDVLCENMIANDQLTEIRLSSCFWESDDSVERFSTRLSNLSHLKGFIFLEREIILGSILPKLLYGLIGHPSLESLSLDVGRSDLGKDVLTILHQIVFANQQCFIQELYITAGNDALSYLPFDLTCFMEGFSLYNMKNNRLKVLVLEDPQIGPKEWNYIFHQLWRFPQLTELGRLDMERNLDDINWWDDLIHGLVPNSSSSSSSCLQTLWLFSSTSVCRIDQQASTRCIKLLNAFPELDDIGLLVPGDWEKRLVRRISYQLDRNRCMKRLFRLDSTNTTREIPHSIWPIVMGRVKTTIKYNIGTTKEFHARQATVLFQILQQRPHLMSGGNSY